MRSRIIITLTCRSVLYEWPTIYRAGSMQLLLPSQTKRLWHCERGVGHEDEDEESWREISTPTRSSRRQTDASCVVIVADIKLRDCVRSTAWCGHKDGRLAVAVGTTAAVVLYCTAIAGYWIVYYVYTVCSMTGQRSGASIFYDEAD